MITRRLVIHGCVQGVGYRQAMLIEANRLGIGGWVRNRSNGTVEACIQGLPDAMDAITQWAACGPARAAVTQVEVFEEDSPLPLKIPFKQHATV